MIGRKISLGKTLKDHLHPVIHSFKVASPFKTCLNFLSPDLVKVIN